MTQTIELPIWLFVVILLFATVTALSHFLLPSVRWFFRLRLERAVARLNKRLTRPIEPFKLARRHDMIQRLIYDPQVSQAIADHAREEGIPENVAFQKARRYAREIVPSFSAFAYFSFGIRLARFLANTLYEVRTGKDNAAVIEAIPGDATVIFVMNHRSNMDYVLVTYLAARGIGIELCGGGMGAGLAAERVDQINGRLFHPAQIARCAVSQGLGALCANGDRGRRDPSGVPRRRAQP